MLTDKLELRASQVMLVIKNPPANAGDIRDVGLTPGKSRENPLEEGVAIHSSIRAWRIPWAEEPGGLESIGSQRVGHTSNVARKEELQGGSGDFFKHLLLTGASERTVKKCVEKRGLWKINGEL